MLTQCFTLKGFNVRSWRGSVGSKAAKREESFWGRRKGEGERSSGRGATLYYNVDTAVSLKIIHMIKVPLK